MVLQNRTKVYWRSGINKIMWGKWSIQFFCTNTQCKDKGEDSENNDKDIFDLKTENIKDDEKLFSTRCIRYRRVQRRTLCSVFRHSNKPWNLELLLNQFELDLQAGIIKTSINVSWFFIYLNFFIVIKRCRGAHPEIDR